MAGHVERSSAADARASTAPVRRGPGQLEAEILAALWAAGAPLTAAVVQREVAPDLAYTTVVTILSRLHDKHALDRVRSGRAYAYTPVADEPGMAAQRMRRVLDSERDRSTVLARFVSDLSSADELLLRALLDESPVPAPSDGMPDGSAPGPPAPAEAD